MENQESKDQPKPTITVSILVEAPLSTVWDYWTQPKHIQGWNFASPDWHCPKASNELQEGGHFSYTMASKNGPEQFDFSGRYTAVVPLKSIAYTMDDDRNATVTFTELEAGIEVIETFEAENQNTLELQEMGWQSILKHFKAYVESQATAV
ncbi:uncharacterized protein YndB with AHSA1/START domain [Dyadobacter jejuensis]|uniref:Uncharacterized protein YndB with AHSA1/START domain n=1 Tax=Dyadobacter jejuensis TaxID=1082580 RepID=A0A316AJD9_9BACT|nr:SRPBCC domain-containing protein [Dyadobacter jejuensis]PWJ57349.1 uncharacterized protein YndB with AHSA1/START domain [Dyadobacter jejuensis]